MGPPLKLEDVTFPHRDTSIGARIQGLSERETGPAADNLVSNEDSYPRVGGTLARKSPPAGAFLGVGPEQNLTLIGASRPGLACVVDYRRRNLLLHLVHKAILAMSSDRAEYLARLTARAPARSGGATPVEVLVDHFSRAPFDRKRLDGEIRDVRRTLGPLGIVGGDEWKEIATIQARLAAPGLGAKFLGLPGYPTIGRMLLATDRDGRPAHFLATEAAFQFVRGLHLADRILPVVGDFAGEGAMRRIADWLRAIGIGLSVVYVSDVEFFLIRAGTFAAYIANLAAMPRLDGAVIVRSSTRPILHPERVPGDQGTTIVRDLASFLKSAGEGRIKTVDDLFAEES